MTTEIFYLTYYVGLAAMIVWYTLLSGGNDPARELGRLARTIIAWTSLAVVVRLGVAGNLPEIFEFVA